MKNRNVFLACILFGLMPANAQTVDVTNLSLPKVGAPVIATPVDGNAGMRTRASVEAMYDYPVGLSCLGIHSSDDEPVCNYLSPNSTVNGGYFLWAPVGKTVKYVNKTQGTVAGYNWILPGTIEGMATTADAAVTYKQLGHYPFPTLECTDAGGSKASYQAEGEIMVSGKGEITTANCRKWGETYALGSYPLNNNAGYIGGTNNAGMSGYGNLFMTSHGSAHITGVNVYFAAMPTKYEDNQQLLLQVWYPSEDGNGGLMLDGLPLEGAYLPVSEIRPTTAGECTAKGAAVGEFRFETPLQIWDKPLFFITVKGFGTDPGKADIRMLMDVVGQEIPETQTSNLLAHNSFVDYGGYGYTMPVNYFGTSLGASFMICPIIDNGDGDATGISTVAAVGGNKTEVCVSGTTLDIKNDNGKDVTVVDVCGRVVAEKAMAGGHATVGVAGKGVYIVKVKCLDGGKDVRKVMVND